MVLARTSLGALRGVQESAVAVFRGVPYAAAPVGGLRWRSPRPATAWTGVRDATSFGPIPPQDIGPERLARRGVTMSEDCLSLNVWTPAADGGRRPVVVFLHGGGVVAGSGSAPLLDGAGLAARGDIVVITLNFRLGVLGSLYAPDRLGVEGDRATNLALRDQLEALRWIRREVAAFGGDPDRVTLAGQSSGAVAIACMLTGDAAHGLFARVILQSGGLERVRATDAAAAVAERFFAALGDEPFARDRPTVEAILAAQAQIPTGFVPPVGPFHPAVDGELIVEHPLVTASRRPVLPVPMLAGTTRHEWRAFDTVLRDDEVSDAFLVARPRPRPGRCGRRCRRHPRPLLPGGGCRRRPQRRRAPPGGGQRAGHRLPLRRAHRAARPLPRRPPQPGVPVRAGVALTAARARCLPRHLPPAGLRHDGSSAGARRH